MSVSESAKTRPSLLGTIARIPIDLFIALVTRLLPALRPFAPKLVPLLVCSLFIPLVLLLSISAGWVVWSSLSVSWQVPLYLQYGDGVPPYAFVSLPSLVPNQRYDITVDLVLPYTESNIQLGNFMTSLTLSNSNNNTVAYIRRPAIALPAQKHLWLPAKASQNIKVSMLESFVAGKSNLAAKVEIGRRDSWTTLGQGYGREVNVISANLQGLVVPHGVRGLAIRFPLFSALVSAGIFICILSAMLGTCILPLLLGTPEDGEVEDEADVKIEQNQLEQVNIMEPQTPRESRRASRRRSINLSSDDKEIKVEESLQNIPSQEQDPVRGLRRRSSKLASRHSDEE